MTFKNQCGQCKKEYTLGPANSIIHNYPMAPYLTYFESTCPRPQCGVEEIIFIRECYREVNTALEGDFRTIAHTEIDEQVAKMYRAAAGIELIRPVELLSRHERQLEVLRWELETATVEDIVGTAIETRLPREWK